VSWSTAGRRSITEDAFLWHKTCMQLQLFVQVDSVNPSDSRSVGVGSAQLGSSRFSAFPVECLAADFVIYCLCAILTRVPILHSLHALSILHQHLSVNITFSISSYLGGDHPGQLCTINRCTYQKNVFIMTRQIWLLAAYLSTQAF
jgi:hypothetical protein